jgi:transcriptional regulator with XRE-family HTH domain
MSPTASALGDFLHARREQIRPEDVGLGSGPRRRVPGLRREELAMLAGISVDYYLRLEQGRDQHPSSQVLNALARALRLDIKATEHLHRLAGLQAAHSPRPVAEAAATDLDQLIDQIPLPAIINNRYQDVLAANAIARALSPGFAPGENFLRWRLLAPAARDFFVDWDEATEVAVSGLRESAAGDLRDPRLGALIDELSAASGRFRELWAVWQERDPESASSKIKCASALLGDCGLGRATKQRERFAEDSVDSRASRRRHDRAGSATDQSGRLVAQSVAGMARPCPTQEHVSKPMRSGDQFLEFFLRVAPHQ